MENINPTINDFAAATSGVLKEAFNRKAPKIAAHFAALGRPMGSRTVRKMTEASPDVVRRNPLEQCVLLLAATRRESLERFEVVWKFLDAFAGYLRGAVRVKPTLDAQFAEFRFAAAGAERAFFSGDHNEVERSLIFVDESLKGLFVKLRLI